MSLRLFEEGKLLIEMLTQQDGKALRNQGCEPEGECAPDSCSPEEGSCNPDSNGYGDLHHDDGPCGPDEDPDCGPDNDHLTTYFTPVAAKK